MMNLSWGFNRRCDKIKSDTSMQLVFTLLFGLVPHLCGSEISLIRARRSTGIITPTFKTNPTTYREEIGSSVTLLCKVKNLGDSIIIWKQPDRIISAGLGMIRKDKRMHLLAAPDGINLEIRHLTTDDAGNYICEVENTGEPILQSNELQVLVPPRITTSHRGQNLTVRKDSSLTLSCNASGFPHPSILWHRQHQMLPSGEKRIQSPSLHLPRVSRSDSGTYICTADNGVGPPVQASIQLIVIYPPEVEVDKSWVHADQGVEAVISCAVYADPPPQVRWYRETMLLDTNEDRRMEQFGVRHRLVIQYVRDTDFGNYSCYAENELGRSRGFIELSGQPNKPVIVSSSDGVFSDRYNISWTVNSYSRITGYRIMYRKQMLEADPYYDVRSRWHNIIPDMSSPDQLSSFSWAGDQESNPPLTQTGSYIFFALEPSTKYEVMIQSKNRHGWGRFSDRFIFSTRGSDDVPKRLPVESQSQTITRTAPDSQITVEDLSLKSSDRVISSSAHLIGILLTFHLLILFTNRW